MKLTPFYLYGLHELGARKVLTCRQVRCCAVYSVGNAALAYGYAIWLSYPFTACV